MKLLFSQIPVSGVSDQISAADGQILEELIFRGLLDIDENGELHGELFLSISHP